MATLTAGLLWNISLVGVLAVAVALAGRWNPVRRRPGLLRALWLLVLIKFVTPPLIPVGIQGMAAGEVRSDAPANQADESSRTLRHQPAIFIAKSGAGATTAASSPSASDIRSLGLLGLWFLGTMVVAIRSAGQYVRLTRLLRLASPADERILKITARSASRMAVRHPPDVRIIDAPVTPMLYVWWRQPVVILPRGLIRRLSDEELQCVLLHELAHLVRRDSWLNTFALLVTALFWWHPVAWWARRELRAVQELCCDALVLNSEATSPRCYAEALFKALEFTQVQRPLPAFASGFSNVPFVRRRFEMLSDTESSLTLTWWGWILIVSLAVILPCVPVQANQDPAVEETSVAANGDHDSKDPVLWKLQEPSGTDWYIQMEGFEGRIVEGWFAGGGGVVLDSPVPEDEAAYRLNLAQLTGGPFGGGFPTWIRAYRFDPDANEFDGSWYSLSVDTESGDVVVREVIDADLAAEIRRKAPGVPVLLPRDAKVWRIISGGVERPSTQDASSPPNGDVSDPDDELSRN